MRYPRYNAAGGRENSFQFWLESGEEVDDVILLADGDDSRDNLLGETFGSAIIDSGCTRTVCGDLWLNTYLDSLSQNDRKSVRTEPSMCCFRFGDGVVYNSDRVVYLPVHIRSTKGTLVTQVVPCNIPLLLSRSSMKIANATLDFQTDSIFIFNETLPLYITESGHYCLSLSRPLDQPHSPLTHKVLFSSPLSKCGNDKDECLKIANKLHKQFAHPAPQRLKKLIQDSGVDNPTVLDMIDDVSASCDTCKCYKRIRHSPSQASPGHCIQWNSGHGPEILSGWNTSPHDRPCHQIQPGVYHPQQEEGHHCESHTKTLDKHFWHPWKIPYRQWRWVHQRWGYGACWTIQYHPTRHCSWEPMVKWVMWKA